MDHSQVKQSSFKQKYKVFTNKYTTYLPLITKGNRHKRCAALLIKTASAAKHYIITNNIFVHTFS